MMEIKVQCSCGQKYKFDVEPANGRMPYNVNCPVCGEDGTERATLLIRQQLESASPAVPRLQPLSVPIGSTAEASSAVQPVSPIAVPSAGALRISAATPSAPSQPVQRPPIPQPIPQTKKNPAASARPRKASDLNLFVRGMGGAFAAGFVGMILWFLLIKVTGYQIGYAAWGVGALTGLGAKLASRQGSTLLGVVAGGCALIAIIGGQYLAARSEVNKEFAQIASESYEEQLAYAKSVEKMETDEDIRTFLAKRDEVEASEITTEEIESFRDDELQELRDIASGKTTAAEYKTKLQKVTGTWVFQLVILKASLGWFTLLWILLGVGSAYKIGADAD